MRKRRKKTSRGKQIRTRAESIKRDFNTLRSITKPNIALPSVSGLLKGTIKDSLLAVEDYRQKMLDDVLPRTIDGRVAAIQTTKSGIKKHIPVKRFKDPKKTVVCIRRKNRRQVLFAKRLTGRGSRSRKRYNDNSNISCKVK